MSRIAMATAKAKTLVADLTITGVASKGGGSNLIAVTSAAHGLETGDIVYIAGVTGSIEANGTHVITKVDANVFTLDNTQFVTAYVSGGTAKHIGFATTGADVDSGTFSAYPDATFKVRIEYLDSGAKARVVLEDASETAFLSAQPFAAFVAPGPVGTPLGASAVAQFEKAYSTKTADVSDAKMGGTNDRIRTKVFMTGGEGKKVIFSSWIEY